MFHVVLHHDAGWAEFDRDPVTDRATGLPYNLVETSAELHRGDEPRFARVQPAATPVLRADVEHA